MTASTTIFLMILAVSLRWMLIELKLWFSIRRLDRL